MSSAAPQTALVAQEESGIYFACVPPDIAYNDLWQLFSLCGQVVDLNLYKPFAKARLSKGCGIVVYATPAQAQAAIQRLNGSNLWPHAREPLLVQLRLPEHRKPPKKPKVPAAAVSQVYLMPGTNQPMLLQLPLQGPPAGMQGWGGMSPAAQPAGMPQQQAAYVPVQLAGHMPAGVSLVDAQQQMLHPAVMMRGAGGQMHMQAPMAAAGASIMAMQQAMTPGLQPMQQFPQQYPQQYQQQLLLHHMQMQGGLAALAQPQLGVAMAMNPVAPLQPMQPMVPLAQQVPNVTSTPTLAPYVDMAPTTAALYPSADTLSNPPALQRGDQQLLMYGNLQAAPALPTLQHTLPATLPLLQPVAGADPVSASRPGAAGV